MFRRPRDSSHVQALRAVRLDGSLSPGLCGEGIFQFFRRFRLTQLWIRVDLVAMRFLRDISRSGSAFAAFLLFAPLIACSLGTSPSGFSFGGSPADDAFPQIQRERSTHERPPSPRRERNHQQPVRRPECRRQTLGHAPSHAPQTDPRIPHGPAHLASTPLRVSNWLTQITKPDSIKVFLFGTPHNHRSPPA